MCITLLLSCIIFTNEMPLAIGGTSGIYESSEPVIPSDSDFTYRKLPAINPTKIVITKYTGKETKVIIPETLGGLPVENIAATAFAGNENLTYVKLPSNIVSVSGKAFNMCSSLTEIDIDSSNSTFAVIDGVLYKKDINSNSDTFGQIKTLTIFPAGKGGHFTIPYGIESIGAYAFDHCYNLTSVDMYNTVTTINNNAFSYCWNLETIRLSDNIYSISNEALSHCDSLTRIDLPSNLTEIGTDAFLGGIDSNNNKFYYFIDGISCTQGSYAYDYLIKQALPKDIIIVNKPSITDNDTGIRLIDAYGVLPENEMLDIVVKSVPLAEVEHLLPTRYSSAYVFDIDIINNNKTFTPDGKVVFDFDAVCLDAIPSATKVYQKIGDELIRVSGSVHSPFIGAQVTEGGRFIILVNDDFSLKGDIDGDGIISLFDVKAALYVSTSKLTLTAEQKIAANIDNSQDGKITTEDARKILRLAGGMENE